MDDVARRAGVSGSTVSHVLNGTRNVSASTRSRVEAAVRDLGYRNNLNARALAAGKTFTVGLATSALQTPYFGAVVNAMEKRLSEAGYMLMVGDSNDDGPTERRIIDALLSRRVDGIVVTPAIDSEHTTIPQIVAAGTPFVLVDRNLDLDCDQITPENTESAFLLTNHLIEIGNRRVAVLRGLMGIASSPERFQGYLDALQANGIPFDPSLVLDGEGHRDDAEREVRRLFSQPGYPTALVALNNSMTIGALEGLRDLGLAIPTDVAFVSYDHFDWSELIQPRLTSIAQNVELMATTAVDLLLRRIDGDDSPFERIKIATTFQHRNSCGCGTT
ncbi:LacI family DNA-binding transcriptional regulator [Subtercola boreus]|nr:LacI family DNA-binding transcriptional regulator [Subtercola boreus]TQL52710.1 LacI family transcriptional regulator [Subtercola boreus]